MHTWMWGYMFPEFVDGLVPLASNPVEIAGRNRVWRKALVDAIVTDPTWKDGDYTEPPRGMASAIGFLLMATSVPLQWQKQFPTKEDADGWLAAQVAARTKGTDANDMIYYFRASEDYDPSPHLEKITAPLLAINSADDFVNPPELPMMRELDRQGEAGPVRPDSDLGPDPRPRHALAAAHLAGRAGDVPERELQIRGRRGLLRAGPRGCQPPAANCQQRTASGEPPAANRL